MNRKLTIHSVIQYLVKLADLQSIKGTSFNKCWITEWIFHFPLWDLAQENLVHIKGSYGILDQYLWMSATCVLNSKHVKLVELEIFGFFSANK